MTVHELVNKCDNMQVCAECPYKEIECKLFERIIEQHGIPSDTFSPCDILDILQSNLD